MANAPAAWRAETGALLRLALPLVLGNLAWSAIASTDLLLLGRIGADAVAAGALTLALYNFVFVTGMGITAAASPLVASERGRRAHAVREVRRTVRATAHAVLLVTLPGWALLWFAEPLLRAIGQDPALARDAARLMHGLQWAMLPWLLFIALRNFITALERPAWGVVVLVAGIAVNALAGWSLIFGHFGLPALGLFGAGLAGTASACAMLAGLAAVIATDRRFRRYRLFGRWWRVDRVRLNDVARIGLPIAATQLMEAGVFNATGLAMGVIGRHALAAHAIAIQIAILSFMVPMGLAQATTVRVGLAEGRGDHAAIGRAGWSAIAVAALYGAVAGLAMLVLARPLLGLFLDVGAPANAVVVRLGLAYLAVAALFQLFDCTQVVAAGALRGLRDTRVPMLFAGLGYWVIGLGVGLVLAFPLGWAGTGLWVGLATGLGIVSALLLGRWARRGRLVTAAASAH